MKVTDIKERQKIQVRVDICENNTKSCFDQPAADSILYHEVDSLQTKTSDDQIVVRRMRKAV